LEKIGIGDALGLEQRVRRMRIGNKEIKVYYKMGWGSVGIASWGDSMKIRFVLGNI